MYRREQVFGRAGRHGKARHAADGVHTGGRLSRIAALGTIVLLAAWAGAATLYVLFRDDALKLIAERQISITRSYQEQVAELQSEIDRLRSLKLIDQERVDRALADLTRRQTLIETRHSALTALRAAKPAARDDAPVATGAVPEVPRPAPMPDKAKPTPLSDTIMIAPPAERVARLESRPLPPLGPRIESAAAATPAEVRVANLTRALAHLEMQQSDALNQIEESYDQRERRIRKVFAELGLGTAQPAGRFAEQRTAGLGGPFLPWTRPPEDPFARQLHRIRTAALALDTLEREIGTVPVRRPTHGPAEVTSGFGTRIDPFVRQLAMHTGVDLRAESGEPVRAAAAGKVVQAERNGGYGLMVEVDHGNGLATRYAHLSAIDVREGTVVPAGAVLGRAGSTGRSTGPHLHYEVRASGEPVDPLRFLRAGLRLEGY
jgi:murein DD-endopeptidase MepM/ murein hydrolase activator NlpD